MMKHQMLTLQLLFNNTVSSPGQTRNVLMINTEQITNILEDALAKKNEAFKIKMEMAMQ